VCTFLSQTHPIITELSIVKAPDQRLHVWTENCPQCQEWSSYKGREALYKPLCTKEKRNDLPSDDQGLSTAKHNSQHVLSPFGYTPYHPLAHPFCLLYDQNLSPQCIAQCCCKKKQVKIYRTGSLSFNVLTVRSTAETTFYSCGTASQIDESFRGSQDLNDGDDQERTNQLDTTNRFFFSLWEKPQVGWLVR